jgi:hypothetical protein
MRGAPAAALRLYNAGMLPRAELDPLACCKRHCGSQRADDVVVILLLLGARTRTALRRTFGPARALAEGLGEPTGPPPSPRDGSSEERCPTGVPPETPDTGKLGRDDRLVTTRTKRGADELLVREGAIHVGGVEEVHALVERVVKQRGARGVVGCPVEV